MPPTLERVLELLFPSRCVVCDRSGAVLCGTCRAALPRIAPPLCARCGAPTAWPVAPLLTRTVTGRRQRGLDRAERRRNVAGAFVARGAAPRTVCLVDDVYTSGATVAAAASALRRAGAARIVVVTLARAVRHG